jgi:hypothetical protein
MNELRSWNAAKQLSVATLHVSPLANQVLS